MEPTEFGSFLRNLREKRRLSLRRAAAEAGVSVTYLWQIEKGARVPSAEILRKMARPYDVSVRELLEAAGYLELPGQEKTASEVERLGLAVKLIESDPTFKFGARVDTNKLSADAMRLIVEVYEKSTGKKLL